MSETLQIYEAKPITIRPADQVKFAREAASVLIDIVKECKLARNLGGDKDHLDFEAWATIAKFYGHTIRSGDAQFLGNPDDQGQYFGAKGRAEVVDSDGIVRGAAEAYCMRDEPNWEKKPNFQLASMAQTRAGGKAARMVFSWVVVLAGYSPTPAEEMAGDERKPASKSSTPSNLVLCPTCGSGKNVMSSQFEDKDSGLPKGHWYCNKKKGGCGKHWAKEVVSTPPNTPAQGEIVDPGASSNAEATKSSPEPVDEGWKDVIEGLTRTRPDLFDAALKELDILSVGNAEQAKKVMAYMDKIPF